MKAQWRDGLHREITQKIIGAGIEVHREMGPGLLESSYEDCLDLEFRDRDMTFSRQVIVPLKYKGKPLASIHRLDLIVERRVIVEIKAVDELVRYSVCEVDGYCTSVFKGEAIAEDDREVSERCLPRRCCILPFADDVS